MIRLENFTALETLEMRERHLAEMRRLRLYHWGQVLRSSAAMEQRRKALETMAPMHKPKYLMALDAERHVWALHMSFVQALNALFDTTRGDTAERDAMMEADRYG